MSKEKAFRMERVTLQDEPHDAISHFHTNGQFVLVVKGVRTYQFQDNTISIKAEDGMYINRNVLHQGTQTKCDYIWLRFNTEMMCPNEELRKQFIDPILEKSAYIHFHKEIPWQNDILNQILQLYMYQSAKAEDLDLIAHQCFYTIFHLLYSNIPLVEENVVESLKVKNLRDMIHFIETHYHEQIHIEDIARHVGISSSGCSAIFQSLVNDSPYHYLLTYRLEKARTLLYETNDSVSMIAEKCGFLDTSHFTKLFREMYQITPAAYRKQIRI